LNKGDDGHYYIRGKDFHRPEEEQDDYWTWQVYNVDATIDTIRQAGYEVFPIPAWLPWSVERTLWANGYIATKGQIAEARAAFFGRMWNSSVGQLADELNVTPQTILNEAGRRGVKLSGVNDQVPYRVVGRIREYLESKPRACSAGRT
jgi:hypothetical protein